MIFNAFFPVAVIGLTLASTFTLSFAFLVSVFALSVVSTFSFSFVLGQILCEPTIALVIEISFSIFAIRVMLSMFSFTLKSGRIIRVVVSLC